MKLANICALGVLSATPLAAQGIFNSSPNDDITESLPLEYSASVNIGIDDNVTPTDLANRDDEVLYSSAKLGANYVSRGPQTNIDFNLGLGAIYYLDTPKSGNADDSNYNGNAQLNLSRSVSEQLRLSTRNNLFYGLEPDYTYGVVNSRDNEEYLYFTTDNAVGYKWTDRVATYTGVKYDSLSFDGSDSRNDRNTVTAYNQFRYVTSQQTIATLDYRYGMTEVDSGRDSDNQKLLAGVEHRLSESAVLVAKAGAQFRSVDGRSDQTDPTFELSFVQRVNEAFRVRLGASYEINDYGTSNDGNPFENNEMLRISAAGDYNLSSKVVFTGGVNHVGSQYSGEGMADNTVDVLNFHVGATYKFECNASANVTFNHTTSDDDSSAGSRDYDRNRLQAGVTFTF